MTHRQHRHPDCACNRDQLALARLGALALIAQDHRLRRTVDVGVDQPHLMAHAMERDREIGGQRGLAHPTLARAHRDDPARPPFGRENDADIVDCGSSADPIAHSDFHTVALTRVEPGDIEHHRRASVLHRGRGHTLANFIGERSG